MKHLFAWFSRIVFVFILNGTLAAADLHAPIILVDEHGVKAGGKLLGGARWNDAGKYLSCDGKSGSHAEIPVGPELDGRHELSLSFWFMITARPEEDVAVKKRDCATVISRNWNWRSSLTPSLVPKTRMLNGKEVALLGKGIALNTWNHLVVVYSTSEQCFRLYGNGTLEAEQKYVSPLQDFARKPVLLGEDPDGYNSFSGKISKVTIYPRALSAADVTQLNHDIPAAVMGESIATMTQWQRQLNAIPRSELGENALRELTAIQKKIGTLLQQKTIATVRFSETQQDAINTLLSYSRNFRNLQQWQGVLRQLARTDMDVNTRQALALMSPAVEAELARRDFIVTAFVRQHEAVMYALLNRKIMLKNCLCFVVSPTGGTPIVPDRQLNNNRQGNQLRIALAPGEYEPASFVLRPLKDMAAVQLNVSDLQDSGGNVIPAADLDLKIVKCWYQAGSAWQNIWQDKNTRVLVPELLLHDASLVKVDYSRQMNYLRLNFPDGAKYVSICHPEVNETRERWQMSIPSKDYPVKDAATLQPLDLFRNQNQQFQLTIRAPENAVPGTYTGYITLTAKKEPIGRLDLTVRILPFKLARAKTHYDRQRDFVPSLYYVSVIDPNSQGDLTPFHKTEAQYRNELKDLYAHGITSPLCYQLQNAKGMKPWDFDSFRKVLELRKNLGFDLRPLYLSGPESNLQFSTVNTPEALKQVKQRVQQIIAIVEQVYGHRDVYFYGIDETRGEMLKKQRPIWNAIHEAGGKIFVACCDTKRGADSSFHLVGDLQDLVIYNGVPLRSEAAQWHRKNHRIWSYCNPQSGVENPEVYRRNYGLMLYLNNYDGFATYCYYEAFGNPWDDFDHVGVRDHNFVYPTADGVIDTIAWEGYREAIDDIRYATTLREAAVNARKNGKTQLADQAEKWLESIDAEHADLDQLRQQMIDWILKLKK